MSDAADKIRRICARLIDEPEDFTKAASYRSELKAAAAELAREHEQWNKADQSDSHQDQGRQSYASRETDSAEGFAEGFW